MPLIAAHLNATSLFSLSQIRTLVTVYRLMWAKKSAICCAQVRFSSEWACLLKCLYVLCVQFTSPRAVNGLCFVSCFLFCF